MEFDFSYSVQDLMDINRVYFSKNQKFYIKLKRILDIILSFLGLIILLPVFIVVAIAIKIDDPKGPVIYIQERVGRKNVRFKLYKFRSMKANTPEKSTKEFTDASNYITRVGKFIRRTSIDELPQLWNVLNGDMSLVGPRPLLCKEEDIHFLRLYYGLYQLRPGITGLAQINGRDVTDDYSKVRWDRTYVRNVSFSMDLKILWLTIFRVISGAGNLDKIEG